MLSQERKAQMIESLKKDYVVLTDIVVEVVADTQADMIMIEQKTGQSDDMAKDEKSLFELKKSYSGLYKTDQAKAVDMIEQIYELSEKYDTLREKLDCGR